MTFPLESTNGKSEKRLNKLARQARRHEEKEAKKETTRSFTRGKAAALRGDTA